MHLAVGSEGTGLLVSVLDTASTLHLPFYGPNVINHFFCEIPAVLHLSSEDTHRAGLVIFAAGLFILLGPLSLILVSYVLILCAMLRMRSTEHRHKAFSTCSARLAVVIIFYGTIISIHMRPMAMGSAGSGKLVSICYAVINPMLKPIIYSLRNKDVKAALRRAVGQKAAARAV
ncbi:hypothetical protein Y1Q_0017401 [Alligator mississippiensis]|uniref:G-protein coupled receptors family 1 profile domain-containing protein n=1 Tax=Alligator mississippiensis TaxID=8496 RepID=A0A151NT49_ALLMI|nr:hypothetical protein Y1Q_0017401 [Alligator mississippiensis]